MMAKLKFKLPKKKLLFSLSILLLFGGACSSADKNPDSRVAVEGGIDRDPSLVLSQKPILAVLSSSVFDAGIGGVIVRMPMTPEWKEKVKKGEVYGRYENIRVPLFPAQEFGKDAYLGLFGVPYLHEKKEGTFEVFYPENSSPVAQIPFKVQRADYRSEVLRVDPDKVHPPKKYEDRIKKEFEEVRAIYQKTTPQRFWTGNFDLPVKSKITSPFGIRRVYNGSMKSYHRGTDLRAGVGTPIRAPAGGKVVLAKNLYYSGNTVLLDHGYGLYTLYAHLSKIRVKKGAVLKRGKLLGLAGATGRVNGPHLHWGAIIHDTRVDPLYLTKAMK